MRGRSVADRPPRFRCHEAGVGTLLVYAVVERLGERIMFVQVDRSRPVGTDHVRAGRSKSTCRNRSCSCRSIEVDLSEQIMLVQVDRRRPVGTDHVRAGRSKSTCRNGSCSAGRSKSTCRNRSCSSDPTAVRSARVVAAAEAVAMRERELHLVVEVARGDRDQALDVLDEVGRELATAAIGERALEQLLVLEPVILLTRTQIDFAACRATPPRSTTTARPGRSSSMPNAGFASSQRSAGGISVGSAGSISAVSTCARR
jgi:hypothetical protein